MNRSFPGNGSSGGGHCWARVGIGTTLNGNQEGIIPTKRPQNLRGIKHNELHDHSWSLTRWTSVSLPGQRSSDLTSPLGFLLYEDAIIETSREFFCLWRLISRCGASKYYLFSVVTKPNLGPLARENKASLQTPGVVKESAALVAGCQVGSSGQLVLKTSLEAQTVKNLPAMH